MFKTTISFCIKTKANRPHMDRCMHPDGQSLLDYVMAKKNGAARLQA
jgi:hypothetical protein